MELQYIWLIASNTNYKEHKINIEGGKISRVHTQLAVIQDDYIQYYYQPINLAHDFATSLYWKARGHFYSSYFIVVKRVCAYTYVHYMYLKIFTYKWIIVCSPLSLSHSGVHRKRRVLGGEGWRETGLVPGQSHPGNRRWRQWCLFRSW